MNSVVPFLLAGLLVQTPPTGPFAMQATVVIKAGDREIPLKLEEKVAFMFMAAISSMEYDCGRHMNRPCTLQELVNRPKAPDGWGMTKLKFDPTTTDPNYTYRIAITGREWRISAIPRKPGLGGFYVTGPFPKTYYNPKGQASAADLQLTESSIDGDGFVLD